MIGLGHTDNNWENVFDYNNNFNFSLAANAVLMLYYIYIIIIYDCVCVRKMLNTLCGDVFLTLMKTWLT